MCFRSTMVIAPTRTQHPKAEFFELIQQDHCDNHAEHFTYFDKAGVSMASLALMKVAAVLEHWA